MTPSVTSARPFRVPSLLLPVVALLLSGGVAAAQILYVPVPDTSALKAGPQLTFWFSNTTTSTHHATMSFVPEGQDGSTPPSPALEGVNAGATTVVDASPLAPGPGLLAVGGAPELIGNAQLAVSLSGGSSSLALPLIGQANQIAAKSSALVQGLRRSAGGGFSNLEIVNVGKQSTQCSVALFNTDGTEAAPGGTISVPPLSMRSFADVLAAGSNPNASDVTAQISCDQAFYPYATIFSPSPAVFQITGPSLAVSNGVGGKTGGGGGGNPPPTYPPGQPVTVTRSGIFFSPVAGNSVLPITIPVTPGGSYSVATVQFDMLVGAFTPHYTAIAALVRPGTSRNNRTLYYGFDIRGNVGRTFIDLGVVGLEPALKSSYPWTVGQLYHIKITYDVVQKLFTLQVSQGGVQEDQVQGANFNWDLRDTGTGLEISFGLPGVADDAYFPPLGWVFSNFSVSMTP